MARKLKLKENDVYGRLTLLKLYVEKTKQGYKGLWKCSCGNKKLYINSKVVSGHTNSCGCYRSERLILINTKHGCSKKHKESTEYKTWQRIKDRCFNKNNQDYIHYGGRGITVCEEWLTFINFFNDMGKKPNANYSIERIDVDKNYSKENCKWILKTEQPKNRRNSIFVKVNNNKMCLKEACTLLNYSYVKILYQYNKFKKLPNSVELWK